MAEELRRVRKERPAWLRRRVRKETTGIACAEFAASVATAAAAAATGARSVGMEKDAEAGKY
jgi:hypothetical protein